jgi:hypothetical protein
MQIRMAKLCDRYFVKRVPKSLSAIL